MLQGLLAQATTTTTDCTPGSETGFDLGNCLKLGNGTAVKSVYDQPSDLVGILVKNIFVVAGVVLFVTVLYAGFKFIQSGSKGKEDAKTIIKTAGIGFIIMFAAYWIVQIIQVVVGQNLIQ